MPRQLTQGEIGYQARALAFYDSITNLKNGKDYEGADPLLNFRTREGLTESELTQVLGAWETIAAIANIAASRPETARLGGEPDEEEEADPDKITVGFVPGTFTSTTTPG